MNKLPKGTVTKCSIPRIYGMYAPASAPYIVWILHFTTVPFYYS